MSLTKCKECENMVRSEAKTCPHCGAKLRKSAWRKLWTIISIILCIVMLGLLYSPRHQVFKPNKVEAWIKAESIKTGAGAYNLACMYALQGDKDNCRKWLKVGEQAGTLTTRKHAMTDTDLECVHNEEWFKQIRWSDDPK